MRVFFTGIGGIGMSALARYCKHAGYEVAGYDRTPSDLTAELEAEGIDIHYDDCAANIPEPFRNSDTQVIYTPAVPNDSNELNWFRNNGNNLMKRSAMLGQIARDKKTIAVAGTHGKTTTSTMLAWLLTETGKPCTAFLGGIAKNFNSNLLLSSSELLVAEADEYDRSFLQLYPHIAIVTAADADHLDIYGTEEEMKKTFGQFVAQIDPEGVLILKKGVDIPLNGMRCKTVSYSYDNSEADFYAFNIEQQNGFYRFDIHTPNFTIANCSLGLPGRVNVENAVAAVAAAVFAGADIDRISRALSSFVGVKRRFDLQINTPQHVYIDDYAHHPEELSAAITSIRQMFPDRKILAIFQPHLYTRTRDFADEFAKSLSLPDELILLDIYPARELPIAGVSSQMIFDKVTIDKKTLCRKNELLELLQTVDIDVIVTLGAGDIDRFVAPVNELLSEKYKIEK